MLVCDLLCGVAKPRHDLMPGLTSWASRVEVTRQPGVEDLLRAPAPSLRPARSRTEKLLQTRATDARTPSASLATSPDSTAPRIALV